MASAACTRRGFLAAAGLAVATRNKQERVTQQAAVPIPLKLGIRAASLRMVGDIGVVRAAASIANIRGVELQVTGGKANLRDPDVVRQYKREAHRWGIQIPSLAGIWDRGVTIGGPGAAESIIRSVRAAEMLGSSVLLLAFFKQNAPDMAQESSYAPVVKVLRETAPAAADAGVVLALENSLSPADNKKLVDAVDHPAVAVYYDPHNMAFYGHAAEATAGIALLGKQRIAMAHVKNGDRLLEEPGLIDWTAALAEFNRIGYDGWYVYESSHRSTAECLADTVKNNAFMASHARMPKG